MIDIALEEESTPYVFMALNIGCGIKYSLSIGGMNLNNLRHSDILFVCEFHQYRIKN